MAIILRFEWKTPWLQLGMLRTLTYIKKLLVKADYFNQASGSNQDFLDWELLLTRKLLNQRFIVFKWSLLKSYDRHYDLSNCYWESDDTEYVPSVLSPDFNRRKTTFATSEIETAYPPVIPELNPLSWRGSVRAAQSLVFFYCVTFVDHCLSLCPFSFAHCIVLYWRLLITPLVSSNYSWPRIKINYEVNILIFISQKLNLVFETDWFLVSVVALVLILTIDEENLIKMPLIYLFISLFHRKRK